MCTCRVLRSFKTGVNDALPYFTIHESGDKFVKGHVMAHFLHQESANVCDALCIGDIHA